MQHPPSPEPAVSSSRTHASISRTALGIASAVIGFGICSVAAQAQEEIRVGVTLTQSPPGSVIQGTEVLRGLEIARDLFNDQGGVLDRAFELIVEDTQGIPERGRAAVEKLITEDEVVALTGEHQSSVCLAEIGLAARENVPFINTNCWSDDVRKEGHPQVFSPNMYNSRVATAMAEVIDGLGVDSVFALPRTPTGASARPRPWASCWRGVAPRSITSTSCSIARRAISRR